MAGRRTTTKPTTKPEDLTADIRARLVASDDAIKSGLTEKPKGDPTRKENRP